VSLDSVKAKPALVIDDPDGNQLFFNYGAMSKARSSTTSPTPSASALWFPDALN
jgi:hypothetical protein